MKAFRNFAICFAAVLALPCLARAQDTGYITGTVTDKSSAAVAGAQVTVANEARGIRQTVPTNSTGDYLVAGLPAATYSVSVSAKGFESFQESGIVLAAAEKRRVDVELTVGAVSERVTVEGDSAPAVETQSSEVSDTITAKQVTQLELNGRNFTQLVTLAPGVSDQSGQDEGVVGVFGNVAYSINGGRTEYNNWEIDGVGDMDDGSATSLNVYPNADAIQEFKVLTSNYGAQYGKNGSGTVEVITKSGTKDFHGDVFYFGRNDFFNSRSFFDTDKPPYKKHDFGYTIGGPVYIPNHYNSDKSKTFFFFSEEWRREKNPTTFIQNVPSDDERAGNFTDLCPDSSGTFADCPTIPGSGGTFFPGNQVPVDAVNTSPLLALVPHANTTNGGYPAWQGSVSTPTLWREELFRIDHNLSSKNRLTFRYIHDSWNTVTPEVLNWSQQSSFPTIQTNFVGPATNFVTKLTTAASPTLLNEFIFGYTADHIFLNNTGPWQRPSTMTMTGLFDNGFGGKLPGFSVSNGTPYGGGLTNGGFTEDASFIPWNNANPIYTYRDNVTKIIRSHNLTFGATFVADQKNEINEPGFGTGGFLDFDATSPVSTGNAFADLLMGNIASFSQTNLQTKYYNRYKIFEPYLQDDWHIKKNLTLNLGLRVSMFGT
ncbi:MAG: carboxypeptidase regulatory-like domain-containing protein [Candidatus Acidiferrales bacterium]